MGTASAKTDKLAAFVTAAATIRRELQTKVTELRGSYDSFPQSCQGMVLNPDLMDLELPGLLVNQQNDETFVAVVKQAFLDADGSLGADGLASVDEAAFTAAFGAVARAAGIDPALLLAERSPVTVDAPIAAGIPRTSGFVADPVCTATGHFLEAEEDLTWPDRLAVLRWRRTYSSRFVAAGPFGRGWASWASVALLPQDDGTVAYHGPDGQMAVYPPAAGPGAAPARVAGVAAALHRTGGGWELRWDPHSDHPGDVWAFAPDGRLATVAGPASGTVTFTYEGGLPVALTHDGGRRLDLDWDTADPARARIVAVRSSCGRVARYRYDDAGDLVGTERVLGDRLYVLDDRGRILEVWDADGVRLCRNTYDDEGRVVAQVSPFGRETTFAYHPGRRTIVADTTAGPVSIYEHDEAGRLVALVDAGGHRLVRRFDEAGRCLEATGFDGDITHQRTEADGRVATRTGPDGVGERWEYDDAHRVIEHTVDGGPTIALDYDGDDPFPSRLSGPLGWDMRVEVVDGLLRSLTDADGVTARFDHDADGNVVAATNGVGATTRTVPHVSGEVALLTLPDGAVVTVDRDDAGRALSVRPATGGEITLTWSPAGRLTGIIEPDGAHTTFEHGAHGAVERVVDAVGAAVELSHDHLERLVGVAAPGGAKWELSYSALGLLSLVHDPSGATWGYDHDAGGLSTATTDPLGHQVRRRYDPAGRLTEVVDQTGSATRYEHDLLGRVVSERDPEGGVTTTARDVWGRPTTVTAPDGGTATASYTAAGRLAAVSTGEGRSWTAGYDDAGRVVSVTDATGATVRYAWDACDRLVETVTPAGRSVRTAYDGAGRVVATERGGRRTEVVYDAGGRVAAVTGPGGATMRYGYDPRGKLTSATDALGHAVRFRYDERGDPVAVVDALGGVTTTTYDPMRRPVAHTDALGRTTRLERDAAGRAVRHRLPTGAVVEWIRDARGRTTDVLVDGREVVVFDRDRVGRPRLIHEPARGRTFTLGWSRGGRLTSLDVDGRTTRWDHDGDGLVVGRRVGDGPVTRWDRDAAGRVVALTDGDLRIDLDRDAGGRLVALRAGGVDRRWDVDGEGLLRGYSETGPAGARAASLVRDAAGRVAEVHDDRGVSRYGYDPAGQLVAASGPDGAWAFAYDPAGRLVREEGPAGVTTYAYDAAHQLARSDGPGGTTVFRYDDAGYRIEAAGPGGTTLWSWDALGRLTGVFGHGDRRLDVDVDALGRLAGVGGTPLDWDSSGPVAELVGVGDRRVVGAEGHPVALLSPGGATTWLDADWRRSRGATDPWGTRRSGAGSGSDSDSGGPEPVGAFGELEMVGLLWLRNRVYDPATRAFLGPDPVAGRAGLPVATNPYHYGNNDPVDFVDPLGLQPLSIEQYNDIRQRETGVQWGNVALVGGIALSLAFPGVGSALAMTLIGAGIGMAPAIADGIANGDMDWGAVLKGGVVGGIAGRFGFAFGGASASLGSAMVRGGLTGFSGGVTGEAYDALGLPGGDGRVDLENVVLSTAIGTGAGGAGYRFGPGRAPRPGAEPDAPFGVPSTNPTNQELLQAIATRAELHVGRPGAVPGTLKHTYAETLLNRYQNIYGYRGLDTEVSYLGGSRVPHGTPGSARLDVEDTVSNLAYDYKFVQHPPGLTRSQVDHIVTEAPHIPYVIEINP
jgi:RHS repeat-associated protein